MEHSQNSLPEQKQALRRLLLDKRRAVPAGVRASWDAAITEHAAALPVLKNAALVFAYIGHGWEAATLPLITRLWAEGKAVAVPLCGPEGRMEARLFTSPGQLRRGAFGLPEPDPALCPAVANEAIGAVLVPGLAFDREGFRIGRGGGYYDRFLASARCPSVGLCYEAFLLPAVPREAFDLPVGWLVTENGALPPLRSGELL